MEQITLDLIPNGALPVIHASQYDDARTFRINLTENGNAYTLTDEVIEIHVRKGDGCAVTAAVAYEAGKTYVDIATTEQMCAVAGNNLAELNIQKNGSDIGSLNFILLVERDPLDGGPDSQSEIHDLQAQVNSCVENAFETLGASGLPYDNTESGLEATNVQDAIDEVNAKISGGLDDYYTKTETDALLDEKADKSNVYTKTEADALLDGKVDDSDLDNYYTKTEANGLLNGKADKNNVYTKSQTDAKLAEKVDTDTLNNYYTSSTVDSLLNQKANKNNVYAKSETYSKGEVDSALASKADSDDVYDKTYMDGIFEQIDNAFTGVNTALGTKADKSTTYTKSEVDTALSGKADKSDTYTKSEVDTALSGKADASNVYSKTDADALLAKKADYEFVILQDGVENELPYQLRPTPSNVGNKCMEKLVGVSCAFNQLATKLSDGTYSNNGVDYIFSGNSITVDGTATANSSVNLMSFVITDIPSGHKLLLLVSKTDTNEQLRTEFAFRNSSDVIYKDVTLKADNIYANEDTATKLFVSVRCYSGASFSNYKTNPPMLIDLTALFGSEVADYLYTLESGTAGAGVTLFRKIFSEDYYPYTANTLMSAKPTSKVVKDSNNQTIATYPFGGAELRGIFKKDANGNIYADGDIYEADGTITRRYESRAYQVGDESLPDAITDGTNTVVKLATPTTETSTAFTNPQMVGATEEFTDSRTIKMPCGHDTVYSKATSYRYW